MTDPTKSSGTDATKGSEPVHFEPTSRILEQNAYMSGLTERLAREDFARSDHDLPTILLGLADEQVELRKTRAAIHLQRAALLIEEHVIARERPADPDVSS